MKKILILHKRNLNKKKNFLFYDEYLQRLFQKKKNLKKNYFYSLNDLKKIDYNTNLLHNKISQYRSDLTKKLNSIHGQDLSEKSWGLILDKLIFWVVNPIIIETKLLNKILISEKNITVVEEQFGNFYLDMRDFMNNYYLDDRFAYTRYIVAKNLGYSLIEKKNIIKKINKKKNISNENFFLICTRFFIKIYIKVFKPNLIINSYLGKKNSIKLFLKSFGRILSIPSKFIFDYNIPITYKNFKIREKLKVNEKDFIDKIFNILIKDFIPASYLENFKRYYFIDQKISIVPSLSSAVSLIYDDLYKFFSVKLLINNKKLISLQHGFVGKEKKEKRVYDTIYQKRYSSKNISWYDKNGPKENFFNKLSKYKFNPLKQDKILIYPTIIMERPNYKNNLSKKFHPYINKNYDFFESLSKDYKNKVKIKAFPGTEKKIKNYWFVKFKRKNLFIENSKNIFNKFKIVIIDDISTPICEILYVGVPFILIESDFNHLNNKTKKKILALKKIKILFEDPIKAAEFLNQNFEDLNSWWNKVIKSQIYISLKKELLPTNLNKDLKKIIEDAT